MTKSEKHPDCFIGSLPYPLEVTLGVGAEGRPADGHVAVAGALLTRLRPP